MKLFKVLPMIVSSVAFLAACSQSGANPGSANLGSNTNGASANKTAEATPTAASSAPVSDLASAKELYTINCMTCHRDTGKGGKVTVEGKNLDPSDLTSEKMKKRSDDKLVAQVSEGSPDDGMPAFKGKLTNDEIKLVVSHIRKLQQ